MASGAAIAAIAGGLLGGGTAAKNIQKRKEEKVKERAQASQIRLQQEAETTQKLQEEQEKTEIAQESVKKQKAKARRRTIFAGQPLEENIFRRTLGG
jgi:Na+/glutamate symporter